MYRVKRKSLGNRVRWKGVHGKEGEPQKNFTIWSHSFVDDSKSSIVQRCIATGATKSIVLFFARKDGAAFGKNEGGKGREGKGIIRCKNPPSVWVMASSDIYRL